MTAVSDETGRDWLPLKYEDGPDFCTVTFATGAAFALTVHPERMKQMEAALSAAPVASAAVSLEDIASEIRQVLVDAAHATKDLTVSAPSAMFKAEKLVTATISKFLNVPVYAAPVAQEPVARLCGYCKTWNSKPCGEQCYLQPSDPVWTSPPAIPAGVGADEIARASNWKLVDGTMTTGESVIFDGSFIIAKVTRREDAELILALLSRGSGDQSHSTHEA